jgi:hypothetical protein
MSLMLKTLVRNVASMTCVPYSVSRNIADVEMSLMLKTLVRNVASMTCVPYSVSRNNSTSSVRKKLINLKKANKIVCDSVMVNTNQSLMTSIVNNEINLLHFI